MMRRTILATTIGLGLFLFASTRSHAQTLGATNIGADPFSLYYGWYLPNQAYQAMQPRIEDTINANAAQRQYNGFADRAGIFDQSGAGGGGEGDDDDPIRQFGRKRGAPRMGGRSHGSDMNAIRGLGPALYYSSQRVASYYPRIARGRGANQNVVVRGRRGAGPGGGMPNMGPR